MSKYKKESSSSDEEDDYKESSPVSSDDRRDASNDMGRHLFGCEKTSDIILQITQVADDPFKLYCHKTCLEANSPYLKSKIEDLLNIRDQHESIDESKPILILNDLERYDKRIITRVIKYMHDHHAIKFDNPILCLEDCITIFKIATLFGMEQMAARAKTVLMDHHVIDSHNFFQYYILAKSYALDQILDELKRLIGQLPEYTIHTSSHLMKMSEFMLMDFITEMSNVDGSTVNVCMSVLAWCRVNVLDVKKLRKVLSNLCESMRNEEQVKNTPFGLVFPVWKLFLKDEVSLSDEAFLCMYHSLLGSSLSY
ncbi:hypothetical protein C9374_008697 [Naegleria lovaniensis]|uniref:BTB domain-containing protein n=1 Tax=Naegleria lovaniensis TaxID=51637 RepID=A0AA88GJ88_NAELO|nr:uncharacterized protein C9374_008697 [Naegleria lovaniensis]KAG2378075.1 hypothetical protein C9374_008697 [Naegleria lovaniensis]